MKKSKILYIIIFLVIILFCGFFIKKHSDDTIYMNDLGALGSFEMKRISASIYEFINYAREHYDEMLQL